MNIIIETLYHLVVTVFFFIYGLIWGLIKQIVPYKYRKCKSVDGQLVLITGTGSGIGRLLALKFASLGARCIIVDKDEVANNKTASEIIQNGGKVNAFKCDLSDRDEIYSLCKNIKENVGQVNILVNNAGIVSGKKFLESSDKAIELTFKVNTMAHFWMTKAFLPEMIENNNGHIVTMASMAGLFGAAGLCDYCASKSAVIGFDESLRNELLRLNKTGVKTTVVCPNVINTGMFNGYTSTILPALEPEYVADKIVEAVLTNQKMLMLPKFMYFIYVFKGLISHETESYLAKYVFKTCYAMDGFKGKQE